MILPAGLKPALTKEERQWTNKCTVWRGQHSRFYKSLCQILGCRKPLWRQQPPRPLNSCLGTSPWLPVSPQGLGAEGVDCLPRSLPATVPSSVRTRLGQGPRHPGYKPSRTHTSQSCFASVLSTRPQGHTQRVSPFRHVTPAEPQTSPNRSFHNKCGSNRSSSSRCHFNSCQFLKSLPRKVLFQQTPPNREPLHGLSQ